jgi:hypothetical protein
MSDQLIVVVPEYEPGRGGVGDYTLRLLEQLPGREQIRLLVPPGGMAQLPGSGGRVLLQYSAYGFDRLGFPRDLIRGLIDWKNQTRGRLVVMFHEIWTFWPVTNKNFFVQLLHRHAIKRLLQHSDVAFTSTASQAQHLRGLSPGVSIDVLPVGSNIRPGANIDFPRKPGWAILFGLQRARIRALQKMHASLKALAAAKQITKVISVGASSGSQGDAEERALLGNLPLAEGFEQRGAQSEEGISEMLATAAFGIFGQGELSYGKSGTFMAYAAHGLNILADCADAFKPEPLCWLVAPHEVLDGIAATDLQTRAERLRAWQEQTSSWDRIGARVAEALQLSSANSLPIPTVSR